MVKARAPRFAYASVFAVALLAPLIADDFAAFPTYPAAGQSTYSSASLPSGAGAGPSLVEGAANLGVDRTGPLAPNVEVSASVPAAGLDPVPSPIAGTPVPSAVSVRALPLPSRAVSTAPPAPAVVAEAERPCPATWICYARVGIAGPVVPYTDCSGGSDVGTAIRSFMCLSPTYLLGHAYTQFGKITQWRAGDVVFAYGRPYTVYGATTQSSCAQPVLPLAPLSLQTSLSPNACGLVLVVQAR